ncbi:MAG: hypothetical protein E7459_08640 [Ruminococcaceae bacterium]|nr:hypothetical protein [Oscillospiraceae bacterium]
MICPNCKKTMDEGYFCNPAQPVQWIPKEASPSLFRTGVAKGAVKMGDGGYFRGYRAAAWYCRYCRLVITPAQ